MRSCHSASRWHIHPRPSARLRAQLILLTALALAGCKPYEIVGIVVPARGEPAGVRVVGQSDARLEQTGIPGANVQLTLDPDTLRPIRLGSVTADDQGRFRMPVDETGAGFLEYELGIYARARGFSPTLGQLRLPGASKRLVVIMEPGVDRDVMPADAIRETLDMLPPDQRPDIDRRR